MTITLTLDQASYTYPHAPASALSQVSATLTPGVRGLVGINGAGKTTLLTMLSRLLPPTSGSVHLDGVDLYRAPRREIAAQIGFMPQHFSLPAGARVIECLMHLAWLKGTRARDTQSQAAEVLDLVGLADRADARVGELSGGMVRRLALGQALLGSPRVLLLDEPTTGLDPEQRAAVRELIGRIRPADSVTVVSSHVMEDLEVLAAELLVLDQGQCVFDGTMRAFRTRDDGKLDTAENAFLRVLASRRR